MYKYMYGTFKSSKSERKNYFIELAFRFAFQNNYKNELLRI